MLEEAEVVELEEFTTEIKEYIEKVGGHIEFDPKTLSITGTVGITKEIRQKVIDTLNSVIDELVLRELPDSQPVISLAGEYQRYFRYKTVEQLNKVN
tara:strand:- start:723 stop:1013 length:291 start_codon:yes stop_codon:yes gene_type:complete